MDGHSSVSGGTSESDCEEPESLADVGGVSSAMGHGPPVAPGAPARRRPPLPTSRASSVEGSLSSVDRGRGGFRKEGESSPRWARGSAAQPWGPASVSGELLLGWSPGAAPGHGGCSGDSSVSGRGLLSAPSGQAPRSQAGQASASAGAGPGGLGLVSVGPLVAPSPEGPWEGLGFLAAAPEHSRRQGRVPSSISLGRLAGSLGAGAKSRDAGGAGLRGARSQRPWAAASIPGTSSPDAGSAAPRPGGKRSATLEITGVVASEEEPSDRAGEAGLGRLERRGAPGDPGDGSWGSEESRLGALVTSRYSSCRALAGGPGARAKARSPEKASDPQGAERGSAGEGSCGGAGCSEEKPKADAGKSKLGRAGPRCESEEGLVRASLSGHKAEGPAGVGYGGLGDWASFSGCSRAPFSSSESLGLSSQGPRPGSLGEGVLRSGLQLRM